MLKPSSPGLPVSPICPGSVELALLFLESTFIRILITNSSVYDLHPSALAQSPSQTFNLCLSTLVLIHTSTEAVEVSVGRLVDSSSSSSSSVLQSVPPLYFSSLPLSLAADRPYAAQPWSVCTATAVQSVYRPAASPRLDPAVCLAGLAQCLTDWLLPDGIWDLQYLREADRQPVSACVCKGSSWLHAAIRP
ncbi:unnamed protein product [Pleuronectes platessa]|uniref:Uncharacterized protein n=1 Tax=Pleuronectes platessa TaxID=8262 RepID=A0A9N7YHE1_PLEPL|nr:unnamed protein product [Pleuronectes platessa]